MKKIDHPSAGGTWVFALAVMFTALATLPTLSIVPDCDSFGCYNGFAIMYSEYILHGEFARWLPFHIFGLHCDQGPVFVLRPFWYVVMLAGKAVGAADTLAVFKASVFLEHLAFVCGIYLLGRQLLQRRSALVFLCAGAAATVEWHFNSGQNFYAYYLMPYVLYALLRFRERMDTRWLWVAGLVTVVSLIGNVPYFAPLYLFVYSIFFVTLGVTCRWKWPELRAALTSACRPSSLALLAGFALLSGLFVLCAAKAFDGIAFYSPGRGADAKMSLGTFLTYGDFLGYMGLKKFWEFLYAAPISENWSVYIGLFPLLFLAYALFRRERSAPFVALLATAVAVSLFSLSALTALAPCAYWLMPGMNLYRHLEFVLPIAKILLLVAGAMGFDRYLNEAARDQVPKSIAPARIAAYAIGVILLCDVVFHWREFPYKPASDFPLQFHFFALLLLVVFAMAVWTRTSAGTGRFVVALYALEILSYSFAVLWYSNAIGLRKPLVPPIEQRTFGNAQQEMERRIRDCFHVRPYAFQPQRIAEQQLYATQPEIALLRSNLRFTYNLWCGFLHIDTIPQVNRTDYWSAEFDRLIRARAGYPLEQAILLKGGTIDPLHLFAQEPTMLYRDNAFMRSLGCFGADKLRLLRPVYADTLAQATNHIRTADVDADWILLDAAPADRLAAPAGASVNGRMAVRAFSCNHLEVEAEVRTGDGKGAWLVYLDTWHPRWRATVNGSPRAIAKANLAFKAVRLDEGRSTIRFDFPGGSWLIPVCQPVFTALGIVMGLCLAGMVLGFMFEPWLRRQ